MGTTALVTACDLNFPQWPTHKEVLKNKNSNLQLV